MKILAFSVSAVGCLLALSGSALARPEVPEIDGSMAAIAVGLTVGMVALMRERRKNK